MDNLYNVNGEKLNLSDSNFEARLRGHSWSILGDSLSHPKLHYVDKKYWVWINDRVGGMEIYNYGISGTRITNFSQRYNQMHYSDIITVFGGVNDWGQQSPDPTPLGTAEDTTNDTFYGALDILCNGILTTFPRSTTIFITPLGNSSTTENSLGLTIYDYADAIIKVCEKYKIPVIDTCRSSLLNPQVSEVNTEYFVDGVHLNTRGHEILSWMIENEILKHYVPTIKN